MDKTISLPVIVDGIRTLKDRSIKVTLVTNELPPEDMATLFGFNLDQATCVLASKGSVIDPKALEVEMEFPEEKSPAKRLRAVLYRFWEQQGKKEDFELYYRRAMERVIDQVKDKLT